MCKNVKYWKIFIAIFFGLQCYLYRYLNPNQICIPDSDPQLSKTSKQSRIRKTALSNLFASCGSGCGSGYMVLMTKNSKNIGTVWKSLVLKKELPALKNIKILTFFHFCVSFLPAWILIRIQQLKLTRIHADPDAEPQPCCKVALSLQKI
jgi:hypothetical protein